MNNLQKMVDLFQPNPIVEKIMGQLADKILELDQRRNLPCGYLKTALALHLPQYPLDTLCLGGQDDLTANRQFLNVQGEKLAKMIYDKIHSLPTELKKMTLLARRTSKIVHHSKEIIEVDNDGRERPVYFARVDPNIGELIQQNCTTSAIQEMTRCSILGYSGREVSSRLLMRLFQSLTESMCKTICLLNCL